MAMTPSQSVAAQQKAFKRATSLHPLNPSLILTSDSMYLSQMQDAQLDYMLGDLRAEIMSHSCDDYEFDGLCAQFDILIEELTARGLWSDE